MFFIEEIAIVCVNKRFLTGMSMTESKSIYKLCNKWLNAAVASIYKAFKKVEEDSVATV